MVSTPVKTMSLIQTITSAEWLIEPDYLKKLYDIANRDSAVETYAGMPLENSYCAQRRGDIAVIPVNGPIFRYANLFTQVCGAVSIEILAKDIQAAIDDPEVNGILLNIDSPGGQVSGINELSEIIYKARGEKPIKAYVGNMAASAAYFIASACGEIILNDMAAVGSIGVVSMISRKKEGDTMEIVSSRAPNKRPDYSTNEGMAYAQQRADELETVFIEKVAKYRGLSLGEVVTAGNNGGIRIGKDAVKNRLCDRLGSFEGVIKEMNEKEKQGGNADLQPAATVENSGLPACDVGTAEGTSAQQTRNAGDNTPADMAADTQSNESAQAIERERARIADIMALSVPGAEAIIRQAISGGMIKGEAALKMVEFFKNQKKAESLYIAPIGDKMEEENAAERSVALIAAEINRKK